MPQASPRGSDAQIAQAMRRRIEGGEFFKEGLPSQAALLREYGVSRSTIERALKILKGAGVIESVQGAGWFVTGSGDRRPLIVRLTELLSAESVRVGDPFPSEQALCERFKASRTAIRTAVAQLEGRGLVSKAPPPQKGRTVRALPEASTDGVV